MKVYMINNKLDERIRLLNNASSLKVSYAEKIGNEYIYTQVYPPQDIQKIHIDIQSNTFSIVLKDTRRISFAVGDILTNEKNFHINLKRYESRCRNSRVLAQRRYLKKIRSANYNKMRLQNDIYKLNRELEYASI